MLNIKHTLAICILSLSSAGFAAPPAATTDLPALAKNMTQQMAAHQYANVEANFDQEMTAALPTDKLQQTWEATTTQVGAFQSIQSVKEMEQEGYDVVFVTVKFDKVTLAMKWVFGGKNKVAGLFFVPTSSKTAP
jgi:hypothetical protein